MMKKIGLYLDTSVIGGCFDSEFETATRALFELIRLGIYNAYLSDITLLELEKVPPRYSKRFEDLLATFEYQRIEETQEARDLALEYIRSKVLPKNFFDDARHVALATCLKIDYILSWNFKHLVNVTRINAFNSVNIRMGYSLIDIRTPQEVSSYDE